MKRVNIRVAIYVPPKLAADAQAAAGLAGQTLSLWFCRAAQLALSPAGRIGLAQLHGADPAFGPWVNGMPPQPAPQPAGTGRKSRSIQLEAERTGRDPAAVYADRMAKAAAAGKAPPSTKGRKA